MKHPKYGYLYILILLPKQGVFTQNFQYLWDFFQFFLHKAKIHTQLLVFSLNSCCYHICINIYFFTSAVPVHIKVDRKTLWFKLPFQTAEFYTGFLGPSRKSTEITQSLKSCIFIACVSIAFMAPDEVLLSRSRVQILPVFLS